jgi:hypothetical protein
MPHLLRPRVMAAACITFMCLVSACGNPEETRPQVFLGAATAAESVPAAAFPTPAPSRIAGGPQGPARHVQKPIKRPDSDAETKEGLENFVRYFIELSGYGFETGQTDEWLSYTGPECKFCIRLADGMKAGYTDGGWLGGGRTFTEGVSATVKDGALTGDVTLLVRQEQIRFFNAAGEETQEPHELVNQPIVVFLSYRDGGWFVDDMGHLVG